MKFSKKKISKKLKLHKKYRPLFFIAVFGLIGAAVILLTQAATNNFFVEPETSTISGNASVVPDAAASGGNAVKFTQAAAGSCTAAKYKPGGDDGMGGCFPGSGNTGVPIGVTLTAYTGPCTITADNTIIDAKTINCDLDIRAKNVLIKRSHINGYVAGPDEQVSPYTFRVEDSFIDGSPDGPEEHRSVGYNNFTIVRSEVVGGQGGIWCVHTCTIQDTWVHGTDLCQNCSPGWHASAIRVEQYSTLIHNTISCDWATPDDVIDVGCSADMTGYPDFAPINHNTMDSNLYIATLDVLGFCAYGGWNVGKEFNTDPINATYVVFKNNVFQRGPTGKCGAYGPITSFDYRRTGNQWTNNKYDNDAAILCDATHDCL